MEKSNYYYMVLNENMQDKRGRTFKLNTQYSVKYSSVDNLCFKGFKTYKHIEYSIYDYTDSNSRFFLVKSTGEEFKDNDAFFCSNITLIKEITRDILESICNRNSETATIFLCMYTNRIDVLEKHIHSPNDSIRVAIAKNKNTPLNMLKILAKDDSSKVLKTLKDTHDHIDIQLEVEKNFMRVDMKEYLEDRNCEINESITLVFIVLVIALPFLLFFN